MAKAKGKTVTYTVTLTEKDAVTFLELLDNASEEGELVAPFSVLLMEDNRVALTAMQREAMVQDALCYTINTYTEQELYDMDDYELRQHLHQLEN